MTLIPEWMSNVHPLIVHFPIALLVIAVVADLAGIILKRYDWLKPAALWLYVFGALGTFGAYLSGKQAADIVNFPPPSYPVISEHADLALYTMLFFGIYAALRLFVYWKKWDQRTAIAVVLFIIATGGLGLVQQTAERGGELVFRYGVGTKAQTETAAAAPENKAHAATIDIAENGSWSWQAGKDAALILRQNFNLRQGDWQKVILQVVRTQDGTPALNIQTKNDGPFLFSFGPNLKNLQITARVNLSGFKGHFFLAHHISGAGTYDFLVVEDGQARLGRMVRGVVDFFDTGKAPQSAWLTLKAVSSSGHYRGYVNDKLITHGHGSDLKAGTAGFAFLGKGSIQISNLEVISLDDALMMNMEHQNMSHGDSNEAHGH